MSVQMWEYCLVSLSASKTHYATGSLVMQMKGRSYTCAVDYAGPDGCSHRAVAELDRQVWPEHLMMRLLGELGAGGWELVSVQHGNAPLSTDALKSVTQTSVLQPYGCMAYLKRPVVPGRPVTEPKLSM